MFWLCRDPRPKKKKSPMASGPWVMNSWRKPSRWKRNCSARNGKNRNRLSARGISSAREEELYSVRVVLLSTEILQNVI